MTDENADVSREAASDSDVSNIAAAVSQVETIDNGNEAESDDANKPEESAPEETAQESETVEKPLISESAQERINQITAEKYRLKRESERLARENEKLRAQYSQSASTQQQYTPASGARPTREQFDYDEDAYIEALVDYKAEQKRIQDETSRVVSDYDGKVMRFAKEQNISIEDFIRVQQNVPQLSDDVASYIMKQPDAAKIAYHIGNNLDVAYRLANSSPIEAAAEIGRLSASISASNGATKKVALPPEPPETVSNIGSSSVTSNPEDVSIDEISRRVRERW